MHKTYDTWVFVMPDGEYFSAQTTSISVGMSSIVHQLTVTDEDGVSHTRDWDLDIPIACELRMSMEEIQRLREAGEWS